MLRSLARLFTPAERPARRLFEAVIAAAREPHWYRDGGVPDTVEGRFAVLASLTALVNLRLEEGGEPARRAAVSLAECFIAEMDGEVRQMGIGDPTIAKQVGAMVGALARRVGRLRGATGGENFRMVAVESLYRDSPPADPAAVEHGVAALGEFRDGLQRADDKAVIAGEWR